MKRNFEKFCKEPEKIENYEKAKADNFKGWECHHRLETHTSDGERRIVDITKKELISLGMYYNRPANELIFLTIKEHHEYLKGKKRSAETKKKLREAHLGQIPWNKGKHTQPKSDETRRRMSESNKGKNIWSKGRHWYNNGIINIRAKECPDGFTPGQLRK